jgi:hypothetical protein
MTTGWLLFFVYFRTQKKCLIRKTGEGAGARSWRCVSTAAAAESGMGLVLA